MIPKAVACRSGRWQSDVSHETAENETDGLCPACPDALHGNDYNGDPFDLRNSENGLSLGLVRSMAEITAYEFREGESLGNRVLLRVKKR